MIEPIIRLCIKDYENTADKKVREKYSILGGLLGIICNLFLFASKFAVGMMSNSIAILSDAFNNLTDMGSSAISIISAKLSNRPPDKDHPFGHGRFEYLASLTIGMIILVVGYKLCETSIAKFFAPEPMEISYWSIGVLVLSIAVKGWMYCYNRYIGKKINSGVNEATAADSINDAIATTGVALQCDYVVGVHDIKIHDYGPGRMFGSLHAEIPDTADLVEVHAALDVLADEIQEKFQIEFSIHMDPLCTDQQVITQTRRLLDTFIQKEYPQYHTDNLRITSGKVRLNIICDLHIPPQEYTKKQIRAIRKHISEAMKQYGERYHIVLARILPEGQTK